MHLRHRGSGLDLHAGQRRRPAASGGAGSTAATSAARRGRRRRPTSRAPARASGSGSTVVCDPTTGACTTTSGSGDSSESRRVADGGDGHAWRQRWVVDDPDAAGADRPGVLALMLLPGLLSRLPRTTPVVTMTTAAPPPCPRSRRVPTGRLLGAVAGGAVGLVLFVTVPGIQPGAGAAADPLRREPGRRHVAAGHRIGRDRLGLGRLRRPEGHREPDRQPGRPGHLGVMDRGHPDHVRLPIPGQLPADLRVLG